MVWISKYSNVCWGKIPLCAQVTSTLFHLFLILQQDSSFYFLFLGYESDHGAKFFPSRTSALWTLCTWNKAYFVVTILYLSFLVVDKGQKKINGDSQGLKLNWSGIYFLCNLIKLFKLSEFRLIIYEMIVILIYFKGLLRIISGISHKIYVKKYWISFSCPIILYWKKCLIHYQLVEF